MEFLQVCAAAIFAAVSARPGGGYEHYDVAGYGDAGIGEHAGIAVIDGGLDGYGGNEIGHGDGGHQEAYVDYHVRKPSFLQI